MSSGKGVFIPVWALWAVWGWVSGLSLATGIVLTSCGYNFGSLIGATVFISFMTGLLCLAKTLD